MEDAQGHVEQQRAPTGRIGRPQGPLGPVEGIAPKMVMHPLDTQQLARKPWFRSTGWSSRPAQS